MSKIPQDFALYSYQRRSIRRATGLEISTNDPYDFLYAHLRNSNVLPVDAILYGVSATEYGRRFTVWHRKRSFILRIASRIDLDELFRCHEPRNLSGLDLHIDTETQTIKLDDTASLPLNQPTVFSHVTDLLSYFGMAGMYLDIDRCRLLKREIEQDLQREANADFLVGGL